MVEIADSFFTGETSPEDTTLYEDAVKAKLFGIQVAEEAQRRHRALSAGQAPVPKLTGLSDLLAEQDEEVPWRVRGLWPTGGNIILSAQFKSGKTTIIGNVVRCLADGGAFLGTDSGFIIADSHVVTPLAEGSTVVVLDLELPRRTLRAWLRDQKIGNTGAVAVESLRGAADTLTILDRGRMDEWAAQLKARNCAVLIIDPFAPLLSACGVDENDNTGVARVLAALDTLKAKAGVQELLIAHHMGHSGERSRGASRLRDWPDAEWRLNREEEDPASSRYFTAFGRDVDVHESKVELLAGTRRLVIVGGNRKDSTRDRIKVAILGLLERQPGLSGRKIRESELITGRDVDVIAATKDLIRSGQVVTIQQGQTILHFLPETRTEATPTGSTVPTGSGTTEPPGSPVYTGTGSGTGEPVDEEPEPVGEGPDPPAPTCCGKQAYGAKGRPLIGACALCSYSPTFHKKEGN